MKKLIKVTALKKTRIALGLSQKNLSEEVGVAISSIGGYERGENPLSDGIAAKIAQVLSVKKEKLFMPHGKLQNKWIAK